MSKKEQIAVDKKLLEHQRLFEEFDKCGQFSEDDKKILHEINDLVMSGDGTAESWSYNANPLDYLDASIEIFELTKRYFVKNKNET